MKVPRNSRSRKGKKQSNLSKVLGRDRSRYNVVACFHLELSASEIENAVSLISKRGDFSKQINLSLNSDFKDYYDVNLPFCDLSKNVSWCLGVLIYHKNIVKIFTMLERKLQYMILNEDYVEALRNLDEIDQCCGMSTWSLGIRSSILKLMDDDNNHTELVKSILENPKYNGFFKTICKYTFDRYDESYINISTAESFRKQLIRTLDSEVSDFLIYKITPKNYLSDYDIDFNSVLDNEKRSSIIDIYKAMTAYIESEVAKNKPLSNQLKNTILKLSSITDEAIVRNSKKFFNIGNSDDKFFFDHSLMDLYTEGKYTDLVFSHSHENTNYNFTTFEIIVKAMARVEENSFSGIKKRIAENIISVILKKDDYYSSYYSLLNLCYAFSSLGWFQELQLFISKEFKFINEELNKKLERLISLNSVEDTPRKLKYFKGKNAEYFSDFLSNVSERSITAKLFRALNNDNIVEKYDELIPPDIDNIRAKKYKAITYINNGKKSEAIALFESVINNSPLLDSYDGLKFLVNAYIDNGDKDKAIGIFVDHVLGNKNNILIFDVDKIANSARELVNETKNIEVPICLSLYSRYIGDKFDSALKVSIDQFLTMNALNTPSDLFDRDIGVTEDKVDYFLEHVCTTNNMKLSLLFDNKEQIELCRIKICNGLIEKGVSKDKLDKLVEETKSITKEQVFKKAAAQVDQSRIYVDTSSLKDNRSKSFKDVFNRFCELKMADYSGFEDEQTLANISKILPGIEGNIFDAASQLHIMNVNFNEKNRTFHKLISMLRDEFTFGEKGLNSYLSTRIRHGVLPTALRKPVQNEMLWSAIDTETQEAKNNTYWPGKFVNLDDKDRKYLIFSLAKFTKSFEKFIDEINDSWLQIVSLDQDISNIKKGVNKSKALFNYSISVTETYILQSLIKNDEYANLVEFVLSWLWHRTDTNLLAIRHEIENKALERFKLIFDELEKDINTLNLEKEQAELILSSIRKAREGLSGQLTVIASWFKRSTADNIEEFELNTAIDIASRSTNVNVDIVNCPSISIKGRYLSSFVDIFYIIFENAVSKSKISDNSLMVKVDISIKDSELVLAFENNCVQVDVDAKNNDLDEYRNVYGDKELMAAASQHEGGTGIFKVCNTINKDFGIEHTNEFGYSNECLFETKIVLKNALEVITYEDFVS